MKIDDVPVDAVGVANRVAWLAKRSIKTTAKAEGLRLALSMIDLTTLEGKDSDGKVRRLCAKALAARPVRSDAAAVRRRLRLPAVRAAGEGADRGAAACAWRRSRRPSRPARRRSRRGSPRSTAAVGDGADEIDMVIDRGAFLSGHLDEVADEIEQVKEACGDAHLKVILETGELETLDNVRHASLLAMRHGADFIKTSTGKISPAATPSVMLVMLEAIRDYSDETGRMVGMKPAGGIRDAKSALTTLVIVKETLGDGVADAGVVPVRRLLARRTTC